MGWPLDLQWLTTIDDFNGAGYQTILSGINHERHPRTDRYEVDMSRDWDDWKLPRAVDNALAALSGRDKKRPFYLNVATQEPHACIWADVGSRITPMPADWPGWMPDGMPRSPALDMAFRRFAASVVLLDAEFGRLMRGLRDLGLEENTLVIFTTDHGMSGPRGKGTLYSLGTEIALLMRWPGVLPDDAERHAPISNISFRSTFADACEIPMLSECQGESFWEYAANAAKQPTEIFLERNFHGEKPWRNEDDYLDCYDPQRAIRTENYLYVRNFLPEAKPPEPLPGCDVSESTDWKDWPVSWQLPDGLRPMDELYDLKSDPQELKNLAQATHSGPIVASMREKLDSWCKETGDFVPCPPPHRPEMPGWGAHWHC